MIIPWRWRWPVIICRKVWCSALQGWWSGGQLLRWKDLVLYLLWPSFDEGYDEWRPVCSLYVWMTANGQLLITIFLRYSCRYCLRDYVVDYYYYNDNGPYPIILSIMYVCNICNIIGVPSLHVHPLYIFVQLVVYLFILCCICLLFYIYLLKMTAALPIYIVVFCVFAFYIVEWRFSKNLSGRHELYIYTITTFVFCFCFSFSKSSSVHMKRLYIYVHVVHMRRARKREAREGRSVTTNDGRHGQQPMLMIRLLPEICHVSFCWCQYSI